METRIFCNTWKIETSSMIKVIKDVVSRIAGAEETQKKMQKVAEDQPKQLGELCTEVRNKIATIAQTTMERFNIG